MNPVQLIVMAVHFVVQIAAQLGKNAIGKLVLQIAKAAVIGAIMRALQPKPDSSAVNQGQELAVKFDPTYFREVIVGKSATGGSIVYATSSGDKLKYLWRVKALCDCEIDSVVEVQANGETLTFTGDIHTGYRPCTSHFLKKNGDPCLWLRVYKGTSSQTADADLIAAQPTEWTSASRGRGVAYAIEKKEFDQDAFTNGEPSLVYIIKGALIADPRGPVTQWTENSALIGAAALKGFYNNGVRVVGLGASSTDVPDAALEDAADECDEDVDLDGGGTEKRYRCGGVLSGQETALDYLTNITASMAGLHIDNGGEIKFLPGVPRTSVMTITEDDLLTDVPVSYVGRHTADELVNQIKAVFVDPDNGWENGDLPPLKDTVAVVEDNDEDFEFDLGFRYVTSWTQGQRLTKIALKEARLMATTSFALPLWGLELEPGDWFDFTSPRCAGTKTFRVRAIQLAIGVINNQPQARCIVSASEIAATAYDWDETVDEQPRTTDSLTRDISDLEAEGLTVTAISEGHGIILMLFPELLIEWDPITDPTVTLVEIEYRRVGETVIYRKTAPADSTSIRVREGIYTSTLSEARIRFVAGTRFGPWTDWVEADAEHTSSMIAPSVAKQSYVQQDSTPQPVAMAATTQLIVDGQSLSWGPFDNIPFLQIDATKLPTLSGGDYYDLRVTGASESGGTAYLKQVSGFTLATQTGTTRSVTNADPGQVEVQKPTVGDSYDGSYRFQVEGQVYGDDFSYDTETGHVDQFGGSLQVSLYYRTTLGGSLTFAGSVMISTALAGAQAFDEEIIFSGLPAIGQHGDPEFRLVVDDRTNTNSYMTDVTQISYESISGATISTATPSDLPKLTLMVTPR